MKVQIICRFLLIETFCLVFLGQNATAQDALENRVNNLLKSLKDRGSYSALLEFMHWPSELANISKVERASLKIDTAEKLKLRISIFLNDPSKMLETEWQNKAKELTPIQKEILQPAMEEKLRETRAAWQAKNKQLTQTEYKILKKIVDKKQPDSAKVVLGRINQPEAQPWILSFDKIGKEWYLRPNHEDMDLAKMLEATQVGASE